MLDWEKTSPNIGFVSVSNLNITVSWAMTLQILAEMY
jgi:hypothetical protein